MSIKKIVVSDVPGKAAFGINGILVGSVRGKSRIAGGT
jgi:hypothetical protein